MYNNLWFFAGELIDTITTRQMTNNFCAVSPCGRFVASSGFTPDVKIWEITQDLKIVRAMELKGHNSGVYSFSFNGDSSRVATVSKDKTWKLWDTDGKGERETRSKKVCERVL